MPAHSLYPLCTVEWQQSSTRRAWNEARSSSHSHRAGTQASGSLHDPSRISHEASMHVSTRAEMSSGGFTGKAVTCYTCWKTEFLPNFLCVPSQGRSCSLEVFFFPMYERGRQNIKKDNNNSDRNLTLINTATDVAQFGSVQSLSRVRLFATPWTAARQASLVHHQLRNELFKCWEPIRFIVADVRLLKL